MPSTPSLRSVCIYGDSHIGSVKRAIDSGLVDFDGLHFEFWGAAGPEFRRLRLRNGAIQPGSEAAREHVLKINGHGRDKLDVNDFDAVLFYGGRLRMHLYMPPLLDVLSQPNAYISAEVARRLTRSFLEEVRSYRIARTLAKRNPGKVICYAPTALNTLGIEANAPEFEDAKAATTAQRDILRGWLDAQADRDGVTLVHQPDHTIADGYFTKPEYACDGAVEDGDAGHKNGPFAAMLMKTFLDHAWSRFSFDQPEAKFG